MAPSKEHIGERRGWQRLVAGNGAKGLSAAARPRSSRYKWVALSNTTLGVLMATINQSILLIALPDIFDGIKLNPLVAANTGYLLWIFMGYTLVLAVFVVSLGRVGDMYGRARMYNFGFATFTVFSVLLSITWLHGTAAALWLILFRVCQGVGGAFLFANSSAILTDAFPAEERGLALGINNVAAIAGSFIGLVLGGLLGPANWHLVFVVSVPFGLFGTVWAFLKLRDTGVRTPARVDIWGNATFAAGLTSLLVGVTYGILPYGHDAMGWASPTVIAALSAGLALLAVFLFIETKVPAPMFRLALFRTRAFAAGNLAGLLAGLGRGGLMFMLIIWLQGIWLPQHGYSFSQTPLWAGIYMLPLTAGFLISGPVAGRLADHFGARPFATVGMVGAGLSFILLEVLPTNFSYLLFALLLLVNGLSMGLFAAPNQTGIMNSLPPDQRGAGAGMAATFTSSSMVLSLGIFFSLMVLGLAAHLPHALYSGLTAQGIPAARALAVSKLPPVGVLFASFLGYDPVKTLLGPTLAHMPHAKASYLAGRSFFPHLISAPFRSGLHEAFDFAAAVSFVAAVASWLRGKKFYYEAGEDGAPLERALRPPPVEAAPATSG
jgi:MFS family permease